MKNTEEIAQKKIFSKIKENQKRDFLLWLIKIQNKYLPDFERVDRAMQLIN